MYFMYLFLYTSRAETRKAQALRRHYAVVLPQPKNLAEACPCLSHILERHFARVRNMEKGEIV